MTSTLTASVGVHKTEALLFFTLLQLSAIVLAGRVGGALALRFGQALAVGEIIVGILLGPSLLGFVSPDLFAFLFKSAPPEPIQILSQLGLILLMFQIGLEFDFSHLAAPQHRKSVFAIAAASLILPFGLGLAFGYYTAPILSPDADRIASALFVATAFSITALPILGRILMDFKLTREPLGVIAISAAAINDVVGWLLLALITELTLTHFQPASFGIKIAWVIGFFLFMCFAVRPVAGHWLGKSSLQRGELSNNVFGGVLIAVFLSAMATYKLGIFAIFGGFIMGVILHDQATLIRAWRERMGQFVLVFFLPIFFTYSGLRTDIGGLQNAEQWDWCVLLIVLATLGKFGGAYLAARFCGLDNRQAKIIGILMNTRGLMELIIINVGLDLGVISRNLFTMLVIMAIVSTVITTPGLRAWLPGHQKNW
ncbi:sodium:proton antiporter [Candidatus Methylospira mobilis]|uniref:Sodium:proton antiporter n=1 Tax=Candidatus Methylospira mobilis TaxID=1808979 RepID=A0A5Q0BPI8_9GAMM|nr:cation:proton antiporter [Candidatus Methylospira mobilis]QFY44201.1 sodium:proton antiporter [Candidatus Methylospira mobilis]